ncbi:MAG: 3-hydroxyacyl-CoA dehydrogenase NAD-binding domain-containing protein [Nitrospinota bacterium]|nr:3-hydroxyacyl-CoA dehydrogenase NAD-binding domain-containing protein [Nitrospinota bacterium]
MSPEKVCVIGAGTMGAGIAQVFAQNSINVILFDKNEKIVSAAIEGLRTRLEARMEDGKISSDFVEKIFDKIKISVSLDEVKDSDFVIEAVYEDMAIKKELFKKIDNMAPPSTIFASNTTSLSITEIASSTNRTDKVIGVHFFNPPVVMKLVEIMPGLQTSQQTLEETLELAKTLKKIPVVANFDSPAGIGSRVLAGLLNEAVEVFSQGLASANDIDTAMKMGAGLPMGPLELIDLIGVDIHLAKTETLYRELGETRYRPNFLLKKMVRAGHLGRKSGRGFYDYSSS